MNDCEVIRDLIPLYVDDAASEASQKLVKEHIESCRECKKMMEDMKGTLQIPVSAAQQLKDTEPFYKLKKSLVRTIIKAAVVVGLVIAVLLIGFRLMFAVTVPVHNPDVSFFLDGEQLVMRYDGPGDILYSASSTWVENNGNEPMDWTLSFYQTFWDRYIHPLYDHDPVVNYMMEIGTVKRIFDSDGTLLWENPAYK